MPMLVNNSSTVQLADLANQIFGEEWAGSVSRFTGIGLRNCQRAKAAAEANEEERRSGAILAALIQRLDSLAPQIQDGFKALEKGANPFTVTPLAKHAGATLTMAEGARTRLYQLLHRAAAFRDNWSEENLLFSLAYDLRKARERLYMANDDPDAIILETVTVRALWPLLLFQLKMLRTTCGYFATSAGEVALLDDLETAVIGALKQSYRSAGEAEDVIAAWHEMGADPHSPDFDDLALSRAAWFLQAKTAPRRSGLVHLLQSTSDLYAALDGQVQDGRPRLAELDAWIGSWPDIDF